MSKTYRTTNPQISDAALARVRAAAHRFVLAGGTLFPTDRTHDEVPEYVDNVRRVVTPTRANASDRWTAALKALGLEYEQHEALYTAVMDDLVSQTDAAFLFGAMVGLEFAALSVSLLASVPTTTSPTRRKGGAR